MKELELCVRSRFNPNEVSLSTIHTALRHGMVLIAVDYETKRRIGKWIETSLGIRFIRFQG